MYRQMQVLFTASPDAIVLTNLFCMRRFNCFLFDLQPVVYTTCMDLANTSSPIHMCNRLLFSPNRENESMGDKTEIS